MLFRYFFGIVQNFLHIPLNMEYVFITEFLLKCYCTRHLFNRYRLWLKKQNSWSGRALSKIRPSPLRAHCMARKISYFFIPLHDWIKTWESSCTRGNFWVAAPSWGKSHHTTSPPQDTGIIDHNRSPHLQGWDESFRFRFFAKVSQNTLFIFTKRFYKKKTKFCRRKHDTSRKSFCFCERPNKCFVTTLVQLICKIITLYCPESKD
jgi:hypothetical protein